MDFSRPNLLNFIPATVKQNSGGWHTFNSVCCHHRGHRPDKKQRGGIKIHGNVQVYHCFNCDFKCGLALGHGLSKNTRQLLSWCGYDADQILEINFASLRLRDETTPTWFSEKMEYEPRPLPECELLRIDCEEHQRYIQYLSDRGIDPQAYPYMVAPHSTQQSERDRIVIPFTYDGKIVGYTARNFTGKPKYFNSFPSGYVFGTDLQKPHWGVCIVVEGIFDALIIDAVSILGNSISDRQAQALSMIPVPKIYVPDQDAAGMQPIERALELGYKVSIPNWGSNIKDVNDAVLKWGRAPVIASILQSATTSQAVIKIRRNKYVRV